MQEYVIRDTCTRVLWSLEIYLQLQFQVVTCRVNVRMHVSKRIFLYWFDSALAATAPSSSIFTAASAGYDGSFFAGAAFALPLTTTVGSAVGTSCCTSVIEWRSITGRFIDFAGSAPLNASTNAACRLGGGCQPSSCRSSARAPRCGSCFTSDSTHGVSAPSFADTDNDPAPAASASCVRSARTAVSSSPPSAITQMATDPRFFGCQN